MHKHRYMDEKHDKISMFRLDFDANVIQDDHTIKLVRVEFLKTWIDSGTLHSRQYLSAQYFDRDNIDSSPNADNVPVIMVYLLDHRVGNIEEPVLYVRNKLFDYYGNEIVENILDPIPENFDRGCIIVQIPLLHGRMNNRLEKVLSIFDQAQRDIGNRQVINIEEANYIDDNEINYIIHRLLSAVTDDGIRKDMNVEEESLPPIENRDTAIMIRNQKIKEQEILIAEQDKKLNVSCMALMAAEQKTQLDEQKRMITTSVKMLLSAGMPIDVISKNLNVTHEFIESCR